MSDSSTALPVSKTQDLGSAINEFQEFIRTVDLGVTSFSEVEYRKTLIADIVLKALGLPTEPLPYQRIERSAPTPKALIQGFVYLMRNQRNAAIKIGWSRNPRIREKTLQSEEPEIMLLFTRPGTRADEYLLQCRFSNKRLRGEWFDLNEDDINTIQQNP